MKKLPVNEAATVAIIMRSLNEQPHTERAMAGLADQKYTDYTLYNCDSGSTDGTLEVVEKYNPDKNRIIKIAPQDYIPGRVLNNMIAMTSEPIICFLNADAVPVDNEWLSRLLEPIFKGEADVTMSRQISREDAVFIAKYDNDRAYDPKNIKGSHKDFFSAVACAFKREVWEETKFPEQGYAEDLAWSKVCQEKGARFLLLPESIVEHSHNFTIKGLYKKRFRHGITFVRIYGQRPNFIKQMALCFKEIVRDFLYAVSKLRIDTIPYNILYRVTIHLAYDAGRREGVRLHGQSESAN